MFLDFSSSERTGELDCSHIHIPHKGKVYDNMAKAKHTFVESWGPSLDEAVFISEFSARNPKLK